jgi:hypothetical protein
MRFRLLLDELVPSLSGLPIQLPKLLFFFVTEVNGDMDRNMTTVVRVHGGWKRYPA